MSSDPVELPRPRRVLAAVTRPRPRRLALDTAQRRAWRDVAWALVGSRAVVWAAGVGAVLVFGNTAHARTFDPSGLTRGLGPLGDLLVAPAARWDSAWYLSIAHQGYGGGLAGGADPKSAFFPLYPLLVKGLGTAVGMVLAGVLVSLAALLVALYLLHRLASLELGPAGAARGAPAAGSAARLAVWVCALAPMAFFLSAVYSESLYLALTIAAFWLARNGRWGWASLAGGLSAATRSSGVLIVVALAILYLYGPRSDRGADRDSRLLPRYRLRPDVLWLALVPAGLAAFLGYLALIGADPLAPFHVQAVWYRAFAGPFGGIWDGAVAAFDGARQLLAGTRHPVYFSIAAGDPFVAAEHNLVLFAFLLGAVPLVLGVVRRLPLAYGVYVLGALALPLSYPVGPQPLMSLPRFLVALFPLHLYGGDWLSRHPRARVPLLGASALALVFFTSSFATWHWVA